MPIGKTLSVDAEHRKIVKATKDALIVISQAETIASKKIETDAANALKLLTTEAANNLKVLTTAAAEALKVTGVNNPSSLLDHDALTGLIRDVANFNNNLTEKFDNLKTEIKADIKEIKDNLVDRVRKLEIDQKEVHEDLEKRTKLLEVKSYAVWIAIFVYTVINVTGFIMILKHIAKVE